MQVGEHPVSQADAFLPVDTRIGDFRIRGLLGEGAMGEVYLAQDTRLGRRVALKLIKRSVMQGDGLDRFFEEARATASFNHPNIVTLHAVGEFDGRPFLALEYVDGESLRTRLGGGPLAMRDALRFCQAIAEAVAEAHRVGLIHADLKPENIVIGRDGRLRVVDFGLAKLVGGVPNSTSGTPAYMAPERWRGVAPTGAIDIWALGVTLHELVTGRRPIADRELAKLAFSNAAPVLPELPKAGWADLVRDCLAAEPAARPTADAVARRLSMLLDPRAASEDRARSPFPGLAAFTRDDAADYFGRRAELAAAVELLRTRPLVPIVGPSGIGKSSFVRAALVPRLEEASSWQVITLRPGAAPYESLAAALAIPDRPLADVVDSLRSNPDTLSLLLEERTARGGGARVLVFIDQFEEAFTLAPGDAVTFCECLGRAAAEDESWRVVVTLRDDFFGRLTEAEAMRRHLGAVMPLPPLSTTALRAAIVGPLANAGYEPDSAELAQRIVDDVKDQPACLPLLQFTCQSLWERRDVANRRVLTREYDAMGGATGALAAHAQRLLAELTSEQIKQTRSIFLSLVNPDGTRRPRLRSELLVEMDRGADEIIDRLLDRRLVVGRRDAERDVAMLELAHEALATAWPQLARWLDETYEERLLVSELEQASLLWQRRGRRDDETWGGAALDEAVRKIEEWKVTLPTMSRAFIAASVERDRRQRRRRRWFAIGAFTALGAIAIAAGIAAIAFSHKQEEAEDSRALLEQNMLQMQLAAADMGEFDLVLEPFDWDPARQQRRAPAHMPALDWELRANDGADHNEPGTPYSSPTDVRRGTPVWRDGALVERVEARSGPAFLEIRRGACAPSVISLRRLPGYQDRASRQLNGIRFRQPDRITIPVPTCEATLAGMVTVPEGEFVFNRQREDGSKVDEPLSVPAFAIDRTEVTRGAFHIYQKLEPWTGDGASQTMYLDANTPGNDRFPVVGINALTAASYCRYMGKQLPDVAEWQKSLRGGLVIDGRPNPAPARLTPWQTPTSKRPANVDGAIAAVATFPDDTSPYGIVDLAGNVSEWTSTPAVDRSVRGLRTVVGATWDTPANLPHYQVTWRNARDARYLDFTIGVRCVVQPSKAR